jgi:UMF1 family MFS transporter
LADTLQGTYLAFLSVAVWWFVFSIPIFRHVGPLIPRPEVKLSFARNVSAGASRLFSTFKRIRQYPELLKYLLAFWLFNDGINTVITMATIYGATIGIGTDHLIAALLITQFVAFPFTLLFGRIAEKFSPMKSLYFSLGVYVVIISLGYFMQTAAHFYMLAVMVGMVQGGSQAVARSIFSRLVPKRQSAEFFGFLGVSSKLSSSFGPFVFGVVGQLFHSSRIGILALLVFFIGGIAMLTTVNLNKGREQAEEADKAMAAV